MKFKYKFLLLLIAISLVGCLYVSQSYAFWMITKEQTQANQITSGCFSISFTEGTSNGSINLTNTYPVPDNVGLQSTPYKFTITNTCTINVSYNITLNRINNTTGSGPISDSLIKYVLKKGTEALPSAGTPLGKGSTTETSYYIGTGTLTGGTRSSTTVNAGQSVTYDLYLWIDNNATIENAAGKTFEARLDVSANPA